jgi:hypothetical protein
MIPRKNFAQPAIFCPAGRPDRFFLRYICSECLGQRSKIQKSRKYGQRLGPRPRRSRFRRAVILPVCPAQKKVHFLGMSRTKVQKIIFDGSTAASLAAPSGLQPGQSFFGRPRSSRKVHLLGMSRTKVQNFARNGVPLDRSGLGLRKNFQEYGTRLRARAASYGLGPGHLPRPSARPTEKVHSLGMSRTKVQNAIFREYGSTAASLAAPSGLQPGQSFFGRPRSSRKVHLLGMSRTKVQNFARNGVPLDRSGLGLRKNFQEYGTRLRARTASYGLGPGHLPRPSARPTEKVHSLGMSRTKVQNAIFREYGSTAASLAAPSGLQPGQSFFGRPRSSRKVHSLGMSRTKVQNFARNGVPLDSSGLGLRKKFPINFQEYGYRLRARAASYELEPGHLSARLPVHPKRYIRSECLGQRSKNSLIEYGSRLWTYAASTDVESGHLFSLRPSLRPAIISLAMAFLSSEKGLGNILKKTSKSTAHASGLTRRQPKLSPAISPLSARLLFARNGVPFVRNELGLGLGKNILKIFLRVRLSDSELGRRHTSSSPAISRPVCPSIQKGTFARNVSDKCPKFLS